MEGAWFLISNCTSMRFSNWMMRLLRLDLAIPVRSAAAEKLPAWTTCTSQYRSARLAANRGEVWAGFWDDLWSYVGRGIMFIYTALRYLSALLIVGLLPWRTTLLLRRICSDS